MADNTTDDDLMENDDMNDEDTDDEDTDHSPDAAQVGTSDGDGDSG